MFKRFLVCIGLLAVVALPAAAQDGGRWQISTLRVAPADAGDFVATVSKLVEAATLAELSADYSWFMYQDNIFEYSFVSPVGSMARFDNPNAMMEAFAGTPGEATLGEAFTMFTQIDVTIVSDIVVQDVEGWGYEGSMDDADMTGAHVDEVWVNPGAEEAYDALAKEWNGMLKGIGYPYSASGMRPVVGGTGQSFGVVFFDSREHFYGEHSLFKMAEAAGHGSHVQEMLTKFGELITGARHYDTDFLPNLSYMPGEGSEK